MKRYASPLGVILALTVILALLSACAPPAVEEPEPTPEPATIGAYFPLDGNARYSYEGMGNEFATFEVFTEYASGDAVQQRVDNGGTVLARVLQVKDGKLIRVFSQGEIYYRENLLDQRDGTDEVLLMEPLEAGTSWTLADGRERSITSLQAEVETPLGTFAALEVTTEGPDDTVLDYYAEGIGLVKTVFRSEGVEITSTLREMETDAARTQVLPFYFPNLELGKIFIKNKGIDFRTNDDTARILEEAYKAAIVSNVGEVLTANTKINRLQLNGDQQVELDLNAAFLTEMNAGAAYEAMILQSLVNTFGCYYGVEEVILTIDGKPYSSGHIELQEGEPLRVNEENTEEIDV